MQLDEDYKLIVLVILKYFNYFGVTAYLIFRVLHERLCLHELLKRVVSFYFYLDKFWGNFEQIKDLSFEKLGGKLGNLIFGCLRRRRLVENDNKREDC